MTLTSSLLNWRSLVPQHYTVLCSYGQHCRYACTVSSISLVHSYHPGEGIMSLISLQVPLGVFIHWTGGLDWTGLEWTGLTQKSIKCLFQCRIEAKHTYSFTKVACIACFRVFLRVGRGQRSRAYLISFDEKIRRAFVYCRNRTPAFC